MKKKETTHVSMWIDSNLWDESKIKAIRLKITVSKLVTKALENFLKKH